MLVDSRNTDALAEKVGWAWSHPVAMNGMGAAARQRYLQHYTAEKSYDALMQLYGSVYAKEAWIRPLARLPSLRLLNEPRRATCDSDSDRPHSVLS